MPLLEEFQQYKTKGVLTEEKPESVTTEKSPSQEFEQYKREQKGETFISSDTPDFKERVINPLLESIGLRRTPEQRIAKSQNIYFETREMATQYVDTMIGRKAEQLSRESGIDVDTVREQLEAQRETVEGEVIRNLQPQIEKNWDNYVLEKYGLMTPAKANQQLAKTVIGGSVLIGAAGIPMTAIGIAKTLAGVGTWLGIKQFLGRYPYKYIYNKVHKEPYYKKMVDRPSELLPDETAQGVKDMVDILEFVGIAKIAGALQSPKAMQKYGQWFEKATKDMLTETKLPQKVYISASKVRDIFQTGTKISAYEKDILAEAGLTGAQYKTALKTGAKIEIPAEKVIKLVDKPYWARIKGLFGLKPTTEVRIFKEGEVLFNSDLTAKVQGATIKIEPIRALEAPKPPAVGEGKIYRGQPVGDIQKFEQSNAIDNILFGRGIFTTTSKEVAQSYGVNVLEFEKPTGKIFDLSNASGGELKKLGIKDSTIKLYRDTITDKYVSPRDIKDAEDILVEAMADKYLPEDVEWNEVKSGMPEIVDRGIYPDIIRDKMVNDLRKAGYDWWHYRGGIRIGGKGEHDVYVAISDKALKPTPATPAIPKELEPLEPISDLKEVKQIIPEAESAETIFEDIAKSKEGYLKIPTLKPIVDTYKKLHDWIFTFGEARRINPKLYDELMTSFSKRNAGIEKAVDAVGKISKEKISVQDGALLSMVYEDKRLTPPDNLKDIYNKFSKVLQEVDRAVKEQGIYTGNLQERLLEELQIKEATLQEKLIHPERSKVLKQLHQQAENIKNMRYLPHSIVAQRAIEAKYKTLTDEEKTVYMTKLSELSSKFKQRKGYGLLRDYMEDGLLKAEDIDIRKLAAETLDNYYYKSALKELYGWSKAQELIKPSTKKLRAEGWLDAREIGIRAPELKEHVVHPVLASALNEMKLMKQGKHGLARETMGMIKIAQFIKPQIILVYDAIQKVMRGMFSLNPITEAKALKQAWDIVMNKTDLYHEYNKLNLYQFPYETPKVAKDGMINMMIRQTDKDIPNWVGKLEKITNMSWKKGDIRAKDLLMSPYRTLANVTWTGDKILRTQSTLILEQMGYSRAEAVKVASRGHGAYSELSLPFKKTMSLIVFVHSFRVLMPIEMAKILTEPIVSMIEAKRMEGGYKKQPKANYERWAKAIIASILMPIAVDQYLKARGFETDKTAWKWKKEVVVDGKKKEVVVGINYILNMPIKWWHRLTAYNPIRPESRGIQGITNFLQWEIHPLWRVMFWDIKENRKSFGSGYVYDPNANWIKQTGQIAKYSFGELFRFYGKLMDAADAGDLTDLEKEEQEKIFDEALTKFDKILLSVFGYKYTRSNLKERQLIMKKYLDKEVARRKFSIIKKYPKKEAEKKIEGLKEWYQRCESWIKEDMK